MSVSVVDKGEVKWNDDQFEVEAVLDYCKEEIESNESPQPEATEKPTDGEEQVNISWIKASRERFA